MVLKDDIRSRLYDALELASNKGNGRAEVQIINGEKEWFLVKPTHVPDSDFTIPDLEAKDCFHLITQ